VVKERSYVGVDLQTCGLKVAGVKIIFGIREHKGSLLSVVEKKRIHHAAKEKGQENTRSTRGEGNAKKKGKEDD
jgi:hypothetical protein